MWVRRLVGIAMIATAFAVSPALLAQDPAAPVLTPAQALGTGTDGQTISVKGVLTNAGTNYFTDRRIVLTIGQQSRNMLDVQPWLPLESVSPPRPDVRPPEVLSNYFGKELILTGRLVSMPVKGVGVTKVLVVDRATVVER